MSQSLKMVNEQLLGFQRGDVTLDDMWSQITANLSSLHGEEVPDPFDDDKAERRTPPKLFPKNAATDD